MRNIIIGDVHGCFEELQQLLNKLDFDAKTDQLFFVGDLVNKGPNSLACFELAQTLRAKMVIGNHELSFLKYLEQKQTGHKRFDALKLEFGDKLQSFHKWLQELPLVIEEEGFLLVHGGLHPKKQWQDTPAHILCNIRTWDGFGKDLKKEENPPWYDFYTDDKLVVFGHWAYRGLVQGKNYIGLDSGCVYGKELSAVILPERTIVQVKAKKVYCPIS